MLLCEMNAGYLEVSATHAKYSTNIDRDLFLISKVANKWVVYLKVYLLIFYSFIILFFTLIYLH